MMLSMTREAFRESLRAAFVEGWRAHAENDIDVEYPDTIERYWQRSSSARSVEESEQTTEF